MAMSDIYTALQQGTIDGAENPLPVILNGAYQEVAKNLVLDAHTYDMTCWIMGADYFHTLTEEQQNILMECGTRPAYSTASSWKRRMRKRWKL